MAKNKSNQPKPPTEQRLSPISQAIPGAAPQFQQLQQIVHQQVTTIFDPEVLRKYKELVPDAPERVLAVFEKNSDSERKLRDALADQQRGMTEIQARALELQGNDNRRRDWMALAVIFFGMALSAFFAYMQLPWFSGGTLVAIIGYAVMGFLKKDISKSAPSSDE